MNTEPIPQTFTVSGYIFGAFKTVISGALVQVYEKDLRRETLLGSATSNPQGFYTISFNGQQAVVGEFKHPDVFIRVLASDQSLLGQSAIVFNIPAQVVIDFTALKSTNEFDALQQLLKPMVSGSNLQFKDLLEEDISFLAGDTGEDANHIALLVKANQLTAQVAVFQLALQADNPPHGPAPFVIPVPPAFFYAWLRLGFATDLDTLLHTQSESLRKAMLQAIEQTIVSDKLASSVDDVLALLNKLLTHTVVTGTGTSSEKFTKTISTALPTAALQKTFLDEYLANEATPGKFWEKLALRPGFTDGKAIERIKQTLMLAKLTGNHPNLTAILSAKSVDNPDLKDLSGFTSVNWKGWVDIIRQLPDSDGPNSFPAGILGNTVEEKINHYATVINNNLKSLFPTDFFAARVKEDTSNTFGDQRLSLLHFFKRNKQFSLKSRNFLKDLDQADFTGINDKAIVQKELESIFNLYKLDDDHNAVFTLKKAGLHSAREILQKYGMNKFIQAFGESLGSSDKAKAIYKNAASIELQRVAILARYKTKYDVVPYVMQKSGAIPADYITMFGDSYNCDCDHCQSVYSPGAYYTDILNFIRKNALDDTVYNKLIARRPDLPGILLTCENTNTIMPHIDLVNELLEGIVVNNIQAYQTTATQEELVAYPSFRNDAAYTKLNNSFSHYLLPFNIELTSSRALLEALKIPREQILPLIQPISSTSIYENIELAMEVLSLSESEKNIINGNTALNLFYLPNTKINSILKIIQLPYFELLNLLQSQVLNPFFHGVSKFSIVSTDVDHPDTCDLDKLSLDGIDTVSIAYFMRFIRLKNKMGWTVSDTDIALKACGISSMDISPALFDQKVILGLSHIVRLKNNFKFSIQQAAALFSTINSKSYIEYTEHGYTKVNSLYEQLFFNKTIQNLPDRGFTENSPVSTENLTDHMPALSTALQCSIEDISIIINGNTVIPAITNKLSLGNLTRLFQRVKLTQAFNLESRQFLDLIELTNINPWAAENSALNILLLVKARTIITEEPLSISELKNIQAPITESTTSASVSEIAFLLEKMRLALLNLKKQKPDISLIQNNEAQNTLTGAMAEWVGISEEITRKVLENVIVKNSIDISIYDTLLTEAVINDTSFLNENHPNPVALDMFKAALLFEKISFWIKKYDLNVEEISFLFANENLEKLEISKLFKDEGLITWPGIIKFSALMKWRRSYDNRSTKWIDLLNIALNEPSSLKHQFIEKMCFDGDIAEKDLEFLIGKKTNASDKGYLTAIFPTDMYVGNNLQKIIEITKTAKELKISVDALVNAINGNQSGVLVSILKNNTPQDQWLDTMKKITNRFRLARRDALLAYILTDKGAEMVAFRGVKITDTDSLFEHLLIDPLMDACMLTSRIKQAINSVQLFVDRCFLNLEEGIFFDNNFSEQWNTWRKPYRSWEANKKILLYPENWIDPALRDDKTIFFKELENKLRQNEVTNQLAEEAIVEYIEKLHTVSNIEVCGFHYDEKLTIMHVIGRTKDLPHKYFYRSENKGIWSSWERIDADIEGDHILPLVWRNRLLIFWATFTEKERKQSFNGTISANTSIAVKPQKTYYEVKVSYSEYKNNIWTAKKTSKTGLKIIKNTLQIQVPYGHGTNDYSYTSKPEDQFLLGEVSTDRLRIKVAEKAYNQGNIVVKGYFEIDNCNGLLTAVNSTDSLASYETVYTFKDNIITESGSFQQYVPLFSGGVFYLTSENSGGTSYNCFKKITANSLIKITPDYQNILSQENPQFFYSTPNRILFASTTSLIDRFEYENEGSVELKLLERRVQNKQSVSLQNIPDSSSEIDSEAISEVSVEAPIPVIAAQKLVKKLRFSPFYHPYVCSYKDIIDRKGIKGLYSAETQGMIEKDIFTAMSITPSEHIDIPYPKEELDFKLNGAYSIYNWELFFHIPLLMAEKFKQDQKFDEARKWLHFIFDPTLSSDEAETGSQRFWIMRIFKEEIQNGVKTLEETLNELTNPTFEADIENWQQNSFNPDAIARMNIATYMRKVVMAYIDILIEWGDQLFKRDTIESINEATLIYVLASNILGKRPQKIPARTVPVKVNFNDIKDKLDNFTNANVDIESYIFPSGPTEHTSILQMSLFCIPANDHLLSYWDTVADRMFKIRNCMTIQGQVRQLPLFEPSIDPSLLVRGTALGLSLTDIINEATISLPNYRFQVMLQKANEFCNDVKNMGSMILSTLEKKDAEELAIMRSGQEVKLLAMIHDVKSQQVNEAIRNLESLIESKSTISLRKEYYDQLIANGLSGWEFSQLVLGAESMIIQAEAHLAMMFAGVAYQVPLITFGGAGFGGSPYFTTTTGGQQGGDSSSATAATLQAFASILNAGSSLAGVKGSFERRKQEWVYQSATAGNELHQIEKQILSAEIRLDIAKKELENHDLQTEHSKQIDQFMRAKFTAADIYSYMLNTISSIYFQGYQLAYDTARKAEKCLQHELGLETTNYIQFGYWDSLKNGLMSGEKLQYDLRRLENAYLEQNERRFEITKHISLVNLNAKAIVDLRTSGVCTFQLPELLFEMDFPGHYFRRIQSVSISIPCIAGPYTSISSQLSLKRSFMRTKDNNGSAIFDFAAPDESFQQSQCRIKAIATSTAQGDTGMFEFNFRDERYLPFEGAGAISEWNLELPTEARQFDYNSISDIIITVRYSAKESTNPLFKVAVNIKIKSTIEESINLLNSHGGLYKLISLKNDFPDEFYSMKSDNATGSVNKSLKIGKAFFPYFVGGYTPVFKKCEFYNKDGAVNPSLSATNNTIIDEWTLAVHYNPAHLKDLEDVYLLLSYSLK